MGERLIHAQWATENPGERHVERRCWCRPVTVYRSKVTGARVLVHRSKDRSLPPPSVVAWARWATDSEWYDEEDPGTLTYYG